MPAAGRAAAASTTGCRIAVTGTTTATGRSHCLYLDELGPSLAEMVFDAGKRRATVAEFQAAYDATVATYRQTVLTAFQQVEDALAAERIIQLESMPVDRSVKSAQRALDLSTAQYKAGTADYLTVITAQTTLLSAQRTQVDVLTNHLTASVQLVVSLGGGWDVSRPPSQHELTTASID